MGLFIAVHPCFAAVESMQDDLLAPFIQLRGIKHAVIEEVSSKYATLLPKVLVERHTNEQTVAEPELAYVVAKELAESEDWEQCAGCCTTAIGFIAGCTKIYGYPPSHHKDKLEKGASNLAVQGATALTMIHRYTHAIKYFSYALDLGLLTDAVFTSVVVKLMLS